MRTVTPKQAAELLQVDRGTIWRWKDRYLTPVARKGPGATSATIYSLEEVLSLAKKLGKEVSEESLKEIVG